MGTRGCETSTVTQIRSGRRSLGSQTILPYTGHGTFVAGVMRCMAPDAEIFVMDELASAGGSTLESNLVQRLDAALSLPVDIFHLSITAPTQE